MTISLDLPAEPEVSSPRKSVPRYAFRRSLFFAVVCLIIALWCNDKAFAKATVYGMHDYGNGFGELILPYEVASQLVDCFGESDPGPESEALIERIVCDAERFEWHGVSWIGRENLVAMIANADKYGSRWQMKSATSRSNYEGYGFKTYRGTPYRCVTYSFDEGTLLRESNRPEVYVIFGDAKFWVRSVTYFDNNWSRVRVVEDGRLTNSNWFVYPRPGTLLREQSHAEVWMVVWGEIISSPSIVGSRDRWGWVRRHVTSEGALERMNKSWKDVRDVSEGALQNHLIQIPTGRPWD
ncbi:MAG: hypothetical protein H7145_15945 [Akkermansiaceae bacterium]|nr:hypothetical protein [Armatimonadota bacterium]